MHNSKCSGAILLIKSSASWRFCTKIKAPRLLIEVRAIWLVNADVPNDLVFAIVRALFHPDNRGLLDSGHPKGKLIRLETARDGLPVPLHPGAEAYYASLDKPN